ncbi:MAG: radical SAM protein [Candidatus Poseidoniales archaeon]|jgi:7-carboxy-7-deazaguanine synthase|nr:radical SAM protein [Candidatus Poseidoniales archaeon]|tara:strand:+ start:1791 stop:2420 length:630 start_codon:yes stop_codon:yes gene_type:complete
MTILNQNMDLEKLYPIVEIFHSVQGEGYHCGIPSIFIRFGRCNLRCPWCDTDFDVWTDMNIGDIVNELSKYDCDRIILTGGEPALQDLMTLSAYLKPLDYYLSIETNGTIQIPTGVIDWICVSPKDQEYADLKIKQRVGDELKVVYMGQNLSMYDELKEGFEHLFLQPLYDEGQSTEWNGMSFHSTFDKVRYNPEWRLSLQTHKWMGVE